MKKATLLILVIALLFTIACSVTAVFAWDQTVLNDDDKAPSTGDKLLTATIVIASIAGAVIIVCIVLYVIQSMKEKKGGFVGENAKEKAERHAVENAMSDLTYEDIEAYKKKLSDDLYGDENADTADNSKNSDN